MLTLVTPMGKPKLLTVKMDFDILAEFNAAAEILRARNVSTLVHHLVLSQISLARQEVGDIKFKQIVNAKRKEMLERSELKRKQAKKAGIRTGEIRITSSKPDSKKSGTRGSRI